MINALCAIVITLSVAVHAQVAFIDPARLVNMAYIPGATFEIGTDEADIPGLMQKFGVRRAELFLEESPRHRVTIGAFYLDRTEVTNAQFKTFVDSNPSWHKDKAASELHNGKYLQHWNGSCILSLTGKKVADRGRVGICREGRDRRENISMGRRNA